MKTKQQIEEIIQETIKKYLPSNINNDLSRVKLHNELKIKLNGQIEKCVYNIDYDEDTSFIMNIFVYDDTMAKYLFVAYVNGQNVETTSSISTPYYTIQNEEPTFSEIKDGMSEELCDALGLDECEEMIQNGPDINGKGIYDILSDLGSKFNSKIQFSTSQYSKDGKTNLDINVVDRENETNKADINIDDISALDEYTKVIIVQTIVNVFKKSLHNDSEYKLEYCGYTF